MLGRRPVGVDNADTRARLKRGNEIVEQAVGLGDFVIHVHQNCNVERIGWQPWIVRLSPIVGPHGRIIAEDVVPKYLRGLRRRVRDLGLRNVVISLGEPHDPRLPTNSLDIAILVHMYHEITQPYGLLYNLVPALKPGARVGVVDAYGPTSKHGTPPDLLRCELAAVGYRQISLDRLKGSDAYLAIFAPPSVASRTRPEAMVACKAP